MINEEELKKKLSPEAYHVLREKGTEAAFSGEYVDVKEKGMYKCKVCGSELFMSDAKFDSGTGWPSFDSAILGRVGYREDFSHGITRTEVVCTTCGSHLGHVFNDLPAQAGGLSKTGKRYCINSVCLDLDKK